MPILETGYRHFIDHTGQTKFPEHNPDRRYETWRHTEREEDEPDPPKTLPVGPDGMKAILGKLEPR